MGYIFLTLSILKMFLVLFVTNFVWILLSKAISEIFVGYEIDLRFSFFFSKEKLKSGLLITGSYSLK